MKRTVYFLLVSVAFFSLSSAQEQKTDSLPPMAAPKVPPELLKLSFLAGEFVTDTKIFPNPVAPNGENATGSLKSRWILDSMFLQFEEAIDFPIFGKYRGMGLLTYDKNAKQYYLGMHNNFGDHPSYKGNYTGDTLILEGQIPFPGGTFQQQVMWRREGDNVKLWVRNNMGQGWMPVIEQTYRPAKKNGRK
ncbi:MAG TPA: DUF1579 family protein [Verrucomicrobiae bacterium]|nr:DUF1579 family protein [Verrucomicrobiae bacterium]